MINCNNYNIPVIIPTLEPDERLLELLDNLNQEGITNVILVNDGSDSSYDSIFETAQEKYQCQILRHCINLGKGRALKNAFNYAIVNNPDLVGCVTADSDGQHTVVDILACMNTLNENREKLVLGCRDFMGDNVPTKSKYGNLITRKICKWICSVDVTDTQTGLRAIPVEFMKELLLCKGDRFEFETQMLIEAKDKFPIIEVPIETVYDSKEDHKTHFNPLIDSIKIYRIFFASFLSFLLASLSSSVLDLAVFSYLCFLLRKQIGIYVIVATIVARCVSAIFNYLLNYKVVFKSTKKHIDSSFRYIMLAIIQMGCSAMLVYFGVSFMNFVPEVLIKIVVDTFLFICSFFLQKRYIFN